MMERKRRSSILKGAALALGWVTLAGCGGGAPDAVSVEAEPLDLEIAVVSLEPVDRVVTATGTVEAWRKVSPGTKLLGRIEAVPVREGDRVPRGGLLARLESRDLEAALDQARAGVRMAEARRDAAEAQFRRMRELHARGSVTDKNLEDATAAFHVAEAAVEQAKADLEAAQVTLSYAEVRSPLAGWVVERRVEAGDMTRPGVPLFTVEDLSRVKVVVDVPSSDLADLAVGSRAVIAFGGGGEPREGRVERIVPAGDPQSRTFRVRIVLENPDGALKSGMFARAGFEVGERLALRVPASAVVRRGQLEGLFVVEEGRARLRWVRLGPAGDGRVEIVSGLEAGERYVVAPPLSLSDGDPVRPLPESEAAP